MKLHHFALTFIVFMVAVIVTTNLNVQRRMLAAAEVRKIDTAVENASVAAAEKLRLFRVDGNTDCFNDAVETFFDSLLVDFGIADIPGKKELLAQYVPVIAITDTDGFWIAYYDVIDKGTEKELVRRWTSKFYYFYLDNSVTKGKKATGFLYRFLGENSCICCDLNGIAGEKGRAYRIRCEDFFRTEGDFYESTDFRLTKKKNYDALILHREEFEEKRHEIMAAKLEEALSYYCGHYNRIAEDYGIEYSFSIPSADEKMYLRAAEGVSFMALFQGYPIKGTDEVVNRFALSNTEIVEASLYVVDKEGVYHRENCENVSAITAYYNSRRECAENGAKPCECCK